jgi:hypothetical protein
MAPLAAAPAARADVVYQNLNPNWQLFQTVEQGQQIGDDVTLAGTARSVDQFQVVITNQFDQAYTGTFTARFFDIGTSGLPHNQLWQGVVQVAGGQPLEDNRLLTFAVPNVTVPNTFIWSLQANTNLPAPTPNGSDGLGVVLNNTPQAGSSQDIAYFNDGTTWSSFDYHPDNPDLANFEAKITAVPEPTSIFTMVAGGLALLARRRRICD